MATTTSAISDAMQLESDLKSWTDWKVKEGKLTKEDVLEIFPTGYSLVLGGENKNQNFREMIEDISTRHPLPIWPSFIAIALGAYGLLTTSTPQKVDPVDGDQ